MKRFRAIAPIWFAVTPVAVQADDDAQAPGAAVKFEPEPREKFILNPTPFEMSHVPEVSPGILIVLYSQVSEVETLYKNGKLRDPRELRIAPPKLPASIFGLRRQKHLRLLY